MRKASCFEKKSRRTGILFSFPILLGTFLFFIVPFCICIKYSFTFGVGGAEFVGFQNYKDVFASPAFRLAALNTLRFLGVGVSLNMLFSFLLALILKARMAGSRFVQSVLLLPLVLPIASMVMVLQVFFAERGVLNSWLTAAGLPVSDWLQSPKAFYVLLGLYIWKSFGYNVILLLSGLNTIPEEFYQTAAVEGAGIWQRLRYITLPLLAPSFVFAVVISIVNSFKSYREAFLLSGRHPHDSIYMLQHFLNNNFESLNYQRLSVAAIMLFLVLFAIVSALYLIQNKCSEV